MIFIPFGWNFCNGAHKSDYFLLKIWTEKFIDFLKEKSWFLVEKKFKKCRSTAINHFKIVMAMVCYINKFMQMIKSNMPEQRYEVQKILIFFKISHVFEKIRLFWKKDRFFSPKYAFFGDVGVFFENSAPEISFVLMKFNFENSFDFGGYMKNHWFFKGKINDF